MFRIRYPLARNIDAFAAPVLAAFVAASSATIAHAQMLTQPVQTPGTIRVQINLGGPVPVNAGEDQKKQVENARVQIYESAKKECDQLVLSFDAHCRLVTLNIVINNQVIGTTPAINATGFAVYELDPEPQSSPRRR